MEVFNILGLLIITFGLILVQLKVLAYKAVLLVLIITGAHELSAEKLKDEIGRVGILIVFFTIQSFLY